ncbi:(R)-mandelonitrile lyase [Methylorubrum extorquens]|jgi:quercetin dioxygenase-like cupin family protein|uniref:(R)-mandelonitrile lyase n=1 Tax=Methylorubrum extorquens TaxID=408 RepID=UPI00288BAC8D|nr:cupin domain-containing protein [Methylorubrum extorquens]
MTAASTAAIQTVRPSLAALLVGLALHAVPVRAADEATPGEVTVTRVGSRPSVKGPAERFSGAVHVDELFAAHPPSRVSGGSVTFEPGARSAWHTHPSGQTLIVTAGVGWVQRWGGPILEMRPGDVVWIPPGVKHWHGAAATTGVTHLAIQEAVDGRNVAWLEKVTDEQYAGTPPAR